MRTDRTILAYIGKHLRYQTSVFIQTHLFMVKYLWLQFIVHSFLHLIKFKNKTAIVSS